MIAQQLRGRIGIGEVKGDPFMYFIFIPEDGSVHAVAHTNLRGLAKVLLSTGARTLCVAKEGSVPVTCTAFLVERQSADTLVESIMPASSFQESYFLEEVQECMECSQ